MLQLPIDPAGDATPEALGRFLAECQARAKACGRAQLASISVVVPALDPLAVLESIYAPGEAHFYVERPSEDFAVAGAEAVLTITTHGPGRFAAVRAWIDRTLADTVAVGPVQAPFGGPHFFTTFTFADTVEATEPFPAACVWVPRWQVARCGEVTTAVANLLVPPTGDLAPLVERVWRAHGKFRHFDYSDDAGRSTEQGTAAAAPTLLQRRELGDYRAAVARALALIAQGELQKIVLARAVELTADQPIPPLQAVDRLRRTFANCYAFSCTHGGGASFIGASPERLLRVRGGHLETEALAGSTRRGAGAREDAQLAADLLRSEKNLREQNLVRTAIVDALAPLGVTLTAAAAPVVRRLANVQHLHTPLRGELPPGVHLLEALGALHPTPAVGGAPRTAALAQIPLLEHFPRGLYAGALGWINHQGEGEFFVGLRSALVQGVTARAFAGAGIVAGSTPEHEWAETELKLQALLGAWHMAATPGLA